MVMQVHELSNYANDYLVAEKSELERSSYVLSSFLTFYEYNSELSVSETRLLLWFLSTPPPPTQQTGF